jgi:hypothetical protein
MDTRKLLREARYPPAARDAAELAAFSNSTVITTVAHENLCEHTAFCITPLMKTTSDIDDELLVKAKALSARERTTLTALIEEGLRLRLRPPAPTKRIKRLVIHRSKGHNKSNSNYARPPWRHRLRPTSSPQTSVGGDHSA